jgi:hypothetical protein
MDQYAKYFAYVIKHKWYVFLACCKLGIWYRGILHDNSKLLPDEFFPYARMFYQKNPPKREKTGYLKSYNSGDPKFEYAWLKHINRNRHHLQYWVLPYDKDDTADGRYQKIFNIPDVFIKEIVADWIGAAKAQKSKYNALEWFEEHKEKLVASDRTMERISEILTKLFGKN